MTNAMATKLASRHLPSEPLFRDIMRQAIELEYVISAMYLSALLPGNRCEFLEFHHFPDGINSAKAYSRETGIPLMINGAHGGQSILATRARYRAENSPPT